MFAVEKRLPSRARVKRSWTQRASTRKDGVGRQAAVVTTPNWRPSDASGKRAVAPYLTFALAVRARLGVLPPAAMPGRWYRPFGTTKGAPLTVSPAYAAGSKLKWFRLRVRLSAHPPRSVATQKFWSVSSTVPRRRPKSA